MAKWADYVITAVRYDWAHQHIVTVRVHPDNGDNLGVGTEWERWRVVAALQSGLTFCTAFSNSGQWKRGEDVHIIYVNGQPYIRTDPNNQGSDNLGGLPEF